MSTESITTAVDGLGTVFTTVMGWVTGNPILSMVFIGGTIVPIGIGIFRGLKRR